MECNQIQTSSLDFDLPTHDADRGGGGFHQAPGRKKVIVPDNFVAWRAFEGIEALVRVPQRNENLASACDKRKSHSWDRRHQMSTLGNGSRCCKRRMTFSRIGGRDLSPILTQAQHQSMIARWFT